MAARTIASISSAEFSQAFRRSRPIGGWSKALAVANSGGPDSTCLLFLLDRHLKEASEGSVKAKVPTELVSLSIDHDLQADSGKMASVAASTAAALGIRHLTEKLPWGQDMYPPKPEPGQSIEEVARDMRHAVFLEKMKELGANALAMGHHCDDQVETMLMRLGRSSGEYGLAGMRYRRRWGMGKVFDKSKLVIPGPDQMNLEKWVVRPLLGFEKDRILTTCEEQKLEYVTDPTNFQPDLTVRNAIRHVLANGGSAAETASDPSFSAFHSSIAQRMAEINVGAKQHPDLNVSLASDRNHLRETVRQLNDKREKIDAEVDEIIATRRITSPPGTFAISALFIESIENRAVKEALLYRIARYVSPEPWGDPSSELGRRKESMDRLIKHMSYSMDWFRKRGDNSICVGSRVWWRLAFVTKVTYRTTVQAARKEDLLWLAMRQPERRAGGEPGQAHPLRLNLNPILNPAKKAYLDGTGPSIAEILFERRFKIRFDLSKMPQDDRVERGVDKYIMKPNQVWILPQVSFSKAKKAKPYHTVIRPDGPSVGHHWGIKASKMHEVDWITIESARPLTAV